MPKISKLINYKTKIKLRVDRFCIRMLKAEFIKKI